LPFHPLTLSPFHPFTPSSSQVFTMLLKERDNRRSRFKVVVVCVALGMGIGLWHNRQTARGNSDFVTNSVRTVTAPFVHMGSGIGNWFSGQFGWLFRGRGLEAENRRLEQENARLREENARLVEADVTAQRLRMQLGFERTTPAEKLAADILSLRPNPDYETMVIARGSRDNVQLRSVVISPLGLIGQVYNVTPTTADVMLLTDSAAAVGARVQRPESRATGVCKGNGSGLLSMTYVDSTADVKVGDTIISSGMGGAQGVFPKGLPIGVVTKIVNDASGSTRRISVHPFVDVNQLEEVYILRATTVAEPPAKTSPIPTSASTNHSTTPASSGRPNGSRMPLHH
jgi:rod shape-determining protein MreC